MTNHLQIIIIYQLLKLAVVVVLAVLQTICSVIFYQRARKLNKVVSKLTHAMVLSCMVAVITQLADWGSKYFYKGLRPIAILIIFPVL